MHACGLGASQPRHMDVQVPELNGQLTAGAAFVAVLANILIAWILHPAASEVPHRMQHRWL